MIKVYNINKRVRSMLKAVFIMKDCIDYVAVTNKCIMIKYHDDDAF